MNDYLLHLVTRHGAPRTRTLHGWSVEDAVWTFFASLASTDDVLVDPQSLVVEGPLPAPDDVDDSRRASVFWHVRVERVDVDGRAVGVDVHLARHFPCSMTEPREDVDSAAMELFQRQAKRPWKELSPDEKRPWRVHASALILARLRP